MPSRERRQRELAKKQAEGPEGDGPENVVSIRKGAAKDGQATKKKASKKQSKKSAEEETQTRSPDATDADAQHSDSTSSDDSVDNADTNADEAVRSDGQQYLGEEFVPKKNKKIERLALDYQQKRDARMAQTKLEVAARKLLQTALHDNLDELLTDEEGRKIYKFPGKKTKVILDTTEKVYVKDVEDEEDEEVY